MLCFIFAALVIVLDQFIKRWVVLTVALREDITLIPGVIGLTHVENTGAAFSILSNQRWLLVGIALVASIFLIAILLRYNDGFWGTLGLAAVLGGTIGNLIDRLFHGYVVDMFNFKFMDFAVFNIADIFITLGGITFLIYFIISSFRPSKSAQLSAEEKAYENDEEYEMIYGVQDDEDQIGLYDFEYQEEPSARSRSKYAPPVDVAQAATGYPSDSEYADASLPSDSAGFDPDRYEEEPLDDIMSALEALSDLESDLLGSEVLEDYDLDKLLQEYGFEDDID
ncbi:MAG: signal peptidase II [Oscillospiraceae bacterium]|nr:signal peptidase II [Oscillospiraceae bacterium]